MNKVNGFLYGLLSSASFGLIPLFTIPAMHQGMQFWSILLYRFLFAMLALACILLLDKQSFRIRRKEILPLLLLAFLYDCSAVFLFWGYKFMSSGVATTIHFMYPVLTTLIMMIFFRLLLQSIRNWKPEYSLLRRFWRKKQFRHHQSIRFLDLQEHSTV